MAAPRNRYNAAPQNRYNAAIAPLFKTLISMFGLTSVSHHFVGTVHQSINTLICLPLCLVPLIYPGACFFARMNEIELESDLLGRRIHQIQLQSE